MYKVLIIISISFQISYSQINIKQFKDFESLDFLKKDKSFDSIQFQYNIIKDTIVNGFNCYKFRIKEDKNEEIVFWIGYKDSVVYSFKKNKLCKPKEIFKLNDLNQEKRKIDFYPFNRKYKMKISDILFRKEDITFFINFSHKRSKNTSMKIREAIFTIKEGFIFIYQDSLGYTWF